MATTLCESFDTADKLINAKKEDIIKIDGMGDVIAQSLEDFFSNEAVLNIIDELKKCGVNMNYVSSVSSDVLKGNRYFVDFVEGRS